MQVSDEMIERATAAYMKETGAEQHQLDGWIGPAMKAALEASLSTEAEPVATVAEMGVGGMRVLIPHPPGSTQHLPIGTKLYAEPVKTAPAVAEDPDALFWRIRIAYLRGAEWRDQNGSMELAEKASYDYADKITPPLSASSASKQEPSHAD